MEELQQIKKFYEEALVSARPDEQGGQSGAHVSIRVSEPGVRQRVGLVSSLSHMSWQECPSLPHTQVERPLGITHTHASTDPCWLQGPHLADPLQVCVARWRGGEPERGWDTQQATKVSWFCL